MLHPDPPDVLDRLTLAELRDRRSLKWRSYPPDVLPLWVAEMDTLIARPIADAVADLVQRGDPGYPYGTAYPEALQAFAQARWGWRVDPELARPVTDVMNGVAEALKLVTGPGDPVVVTPPVYPPFYAFIRSLNRELIEAPLGADGRLDLVALRHALGAAAQRSDRRALLLSNPHNPTGVAHSREELTKVSRLAARFRARVVVDEIHAPLVYDEAAFTPYLTVPGGDWGFSVLSASKGWNLAALKAALLVAGNASAVDLARMPDVASHGASMLGVVAHSTAFRGAEDWLDEHRDALDRRRRLLADLLTELLPEVPYRLPQATFLAWLDCRPLGLGDDPSAFFLRRARVALSSGPTFGTGGAGHVRLNFATTTEVLIAAVRRMADAVRAAVPTRSG